LRVTELSRERFSLADTRELGWILPSAGSYYGRAVLTACRRAGFEPQVLHEVTDTAATLALVEAGVRVSVVTCARRWSVTSS
jgi:DNA-binding transcriptional LysR family regulator